MVQDEVCEPGEGVRNLFLVEMSPQQAKILLMVSHGETVLGVIHMEPSWGIAQSMVLTLLHMKVPKDL